MIITSDDLERRRGAIAASRDLLAMQARLAADLEPFLSRPAYVPERKALLSRWGSLCKDCGAELGFDPWSPERQRCAGCGREWSTEHSQRWWIYWYQLWMAERVLHAALLARLTGEARPADKAAEVLALVAERYPGYPNADNVLGPARAFFSTYLESVWALHLATAAALLERSLGTALMGDLQARLFRPAADVIADFDEPGSNRQVWNAAALYALGRLLGDDALARRAAHGETGIVATLDRGILDDGLWYEGENYHWFALRGLVWGAELLRATGDVDLWASGDAPGRKLRAAFRAPLLTVLPDFTYPARRDSKFGVTLRQRRMAELWELALARSPADDVVASVLRFVYDPAQPEPGGTAALISDVERSEPARGARREALGWKGLLWALPELPAAPPDAWRPGTAHLETTGLAIFRRGAGDYVSLDYGEGGGGHGHPDRLTLTYVAAGVPWLLDFGTGSYVSRSLAWYRSTLAHNAPLVDSASQAPATGRCAAFEEQEGAAWVCAQLPENSAYDGLTLQRTVVVTPWYVLDVLQAGSTAGERLLVLPWHGLGDVAADAHGLTFTKPDGAQLRVLLSARHPFQVQFGEGYAPPAPAGEAPPLRFAVAAATGEELTLAACLAAAADVDELECIEDGFVVRLSDGRVHVHTATDDGWKIELERGDPITLAGLRDLPPIAPALPTGSSMESLFNPLAGAASVQPNAAAHCRAVGRPPELDGTLEGFDVSAPLELDRADQFRRAEEPWEGPDAFGARAWLNHDEDTIYLAVEVRAAESQFRSGEAPDPELDNENPDIHSDGLQVYVSTSLFYGWVVVPDADDESHVRAARVAGSDAEVDMVRGAWARTPAGYRVTLALALPDALEGFGFDLMVNRAREGRERRVGQLVWSGAGGRRLYLAGDRPMDGELPWVAVD